MQVGEASEKVTVTAETPLLDATSASMGSVVDQQRGFTMGSEATFGSPSYEEHFREQFEKDLKFYQLFLRLINKSCLITTVDLVWAEDGPVGRAGLRQELVRAEQALTSPCARLLSGSSIFAPVFCNHLESCAISDNAAEKRVRQTGKAEYYTCQAGLIDIAVPVFADGRHIATLFTGQVRREPPSQAGLSELRQRLTGVVSLDWGEVEKSYWQVPVVSDTDIQNTIQVLEVFGEFLGTTWKRLFDTAKEQGHKNRELQMARKEFAHLVLEGAIRDQVALQELMARLGFKRYPNRVLVVRLETEEEYHTPTTSFDLALTRAVQSVEEFCETLPNVTCAYLRKQGICVFLRSRESSGSGFQAQAIGSKILRAISSVSDVRARIGIGGAKTNWLYLGDSYHEACVALAASSVPIAVYSAPSEASEALSTSLAQICVYISQGSLEDARTMLASLPLQVSQSLGDKAEHLTEQRHFFSYALEMMTYAVRSLNPNGEASEIESSSRSEEALAGAGSSVFELREAFLCRAEALLGEVHRLYSGRREKLIERARRMIQKELGDSTSAQNLSISLIASQLGISTGHLSRIFKRTTGFSFERNVMMMRVEMAKCFLLEPLISITDVAERCGFLDSAYFAKVFHKLVGCSPREYREAPSRFLSLAPTERSCAVESQPSVPRPPLSALSPDASKTSAKANT